ncbi:hypothetical protein NONO_c36830 [Nocardia nova SH22a]|uniref:Uncharacterized protein n=2 Tax=Nocardia nova TaxID=37330 RepID=W5TGJ9_9NOCA|nr:hypothetical protein NONO_c36830 [Nocardia nova SH22a]
MAPHNALTTDLTVLSLDELVALFRTLEAPSITEMHGEFDGTPLRQPGLLRSAIAFAKVGNPLYPWRAKGFRPLDHGSSGRGYNIHRRVIGGRDVQRDPMLTRIAPSHLDGRPAFQLDYRPFATVNGAINLIDDVRRVRPGVYLGFGMWGFTDKQRRVLQPFMLERTSRTYRGDIGTFRS